MKKRGPLRIPLEGQCVLIECSGLPGVDSAVSIYSFTIDRRGGAIVIHVPGNHRSPDDCIPKSLEQETWLDGLTDLMHRSWGCEWDIKDEISLEVFINMLEPLMERYRFEIR
jgi:hypothetical protein